MRWKTKQSPNIGDTRVVKRFLLFPKEIDGEYRWLEVSRIEQRYERDYISVGLGMGSYCRWQDSAWVIMESESE
jgi:hypothetical protein